MLRAEEANFKVISILGDSVANGFFDESNLGWVVRMGQQLQEDTPRGFYIRNFAISGDHVTECIERFRSQIVGHPGDCLIIACGVNDLARWGRREAGNSLSIGYSMRVWNLLLTEAKKLFEHIYVCQVLPVNEVKVPARMNEQGLEQFYRNDDIAAYNSELEKMCALHACRFVDFSAEVKSVDWNAHLFDDVHPNAKGHALIAKRMVKELKVAFP